MHHRDGHFNFSEFKAISVFHGLWQGWVANFGHHDIFLWVNDPDLGQASPVAKGLHLNSLALCDVRKSVPTPHEMMEALSGPHEVRKKLTSPPKPNTR